MAGLSENPRAARGVEYGIATEAVYGTEDNASGGPNVVSLTCDDVDIDPGLNIQVFRVSHGSNQPIMEEDTRNLSGSAATLTISGPINTHTFGIFAGAYFQTGTWTATTFVGPFTPYDVGSHPDFDGDQKGFTFYKRSAFTGRDEIVKGCIVTGLKISGEKKGVLMFEATVQGKSSHSNQTLAGTWQTSGSKPDNWGRIHFEDCGYKIDAGSGDTVVKPQNFEVACGYDIIDQEQPDEDGGYDALAIVDPNGTFTTTILKDPTTALVRTLRDTGKGITFTISGNLDLVCTGKIDSDPDEREGLSKVNVSCKMLAEDEDNDMINLSW